MEKAKEQLQYAGIHTLLDSLHLLEIDGTLRLYFLMITDNTSICHSQITFLQISYR
jgi:hypothetical protein